MPFLVKFISSVHATVMKKGIAKTNLPRRRYASFIRNFLCNSRYVGILNSPFLAITTKTNYAFSPRLFRLLLFYRAFFLLLPTSFLSFFTGGKKKGNRLYNCGVGPSSQRTKRKNNNWKHVSDTVFGRSFEFAPILNFNRVS